MRKKYNINCATPLFAEGCSKWNVIGSVNETTCELTFSATCSNPLVPVPDISNGHLDLTVESDGLVGRDTLASGTFESNEDAHTVTASGTYTVLDTDPRTFRVDFALPGSLAGEKV